MASSGEDPLPEYAGALPDPEESHIMVFGPKRSGKSNWLQYYLRHLDDTSLLVDTVQEHGDTDLDRYVPTHRRGDKAVAELDEALTRLVTEQDRDRRPDLVAVEEISRYAPSRGAMPEALDELVDLNRHYGVGVLGVGRRPARVNADLVELADELVLFRMRGKNDKRRLEAEAEGLGDAVEDLDEYEWLRVRGDRSWEVMPPVPEMDTTGEL